MRTPILTELPVSKENTEEFKGLNHNLRTEPGEWFNQKNMTTDFYPAASPRGKRSLQQSAQEIEMSVAFDNESTEITLTEDVKGMCYTDGSLYTLQQMKVSNEIIGYWFLRDGNPIGNDANSFAYTFNNAKFEFYSTRTVTPASPQQPAVVIGMYKIINIDLSNADISAGNILFISCEGQIYGNCTVTEIITDNGSNVGFKFERYISPHNQFGYSHNSTTVKVININKKLEGIISKAGVFNTADNSYRSVVRMGANLCTFPEGVVYETSNTSESVPVKRIGEEKTSQTLEAQTIIKSDGDSEYTPIDIGQSYRISDSQVQYYLNDEATWVNQPTNVMIFAKNISNTFEAFKTGDTVSISYSSILSNDIYTTPISKSGIFGERKEEARVKIIQKGTIQSNSDLGISSATDYIIVSGHIHIHNSYQNSDYGDNRLKATLSTAVIKRKCPDIKFACESQNKIWACSKDGHEIYASALGNPYNFYDYSGLSTDSYAVNVGTYGEFTGCINYLGTPLFFKENALHAISGSYPTNGGELDGMSYSVQTTTEFKGVEKGSERSLAIIDNILFYKSAAGIVAYDGANTAVISDALGKERYKNAVAGAYKNKYYVSMQDSNGDYHMFVYDTEMGTWCREDNTHALQFINVNNELLYLNADDNMIYSVSDEDVLFNNDFEKEIDFEWMCETQNFGYSYPNNKYLSRFQFRVQISDGARAAFFIQYNSDGVWHKKGEMTGKGIRTHLFPIVPIRCDHMKIKVEGTGDVKIFSISKILEEGGDV